MHRHYPLYLLAHLPAAFALCYAPDGSLSPGDGDLPCVATLNVDSMCCVLNGTALNRIGKTAADADTCLPNGLCQNAGTFYRTFCTDQTWKSPSCLNVCTGDSSGGTASSYTALTHCSDGSWCCGTNNLTSCCNLNLGFQIANSIVPYAASATATAATGATATSTVTVSSTSTPSNLNNSLGIGLGVALGAVLLVATVTGLVIYRRHRGRQQIDGQWSRKPIEVGPSYHGGMSELDQSIVIDEFLTRREPVEIDGVARRP